MGATRMSRMDWIAMATRNVAWAREYHDEDDIGSRDGCLLTAAGAYREAEMDGMALWCERFLGSPARG